MSKAKLNFKVDGTNNEKVGKVITAITIAKLIPIYIIALIVLAGGLFCLIFAGNTSRHCTEKVMAVVVEYVEDEPMKIEKANGKVEYATMYAPVFRFTLNGEECTIKSKFASNDKPYEVGKEMKIKVNPDDPNETYVPHKNGAVNIGFSLLGTSVLFAGLATIIVLRTASAPKLAGSLSGGKIKLK